MESRVEMRERRSQICSHGGFCGRFSMAGVAKDRREGNCSGVPALQVWQYTHLLLPLLLGEWDSDLDA